MLLALEHNTGSPVQQGNQASSCLRASLGFSTTTWTLQVHFTMRSCVGTSLLRTCCAGPLRCPLLAPACWSTILPKIASKAPWPCLARGCWKRQVPAGTCRLQRIVEMPLLALLMSDLEDSDTDSESSSDAGLSSSQPPWDCVQGHPWVLGGHQASLGRDMGAAGVLYHAKLCWDFAAVHLLRRSTQMPFACTNPPVEAQQLLTLQPYGWRVSV